MNEQLIPDSGDGGSSSASSIASQSLQRSASLLERIRAQREREAQAAAESPAVTSTSAGVEANNNASVPVVPNYTPISSDAVGGGGGESSFSFSGFSMNFGGPVDTNEASEGLLSDYRGISGNDYSILAYFRMFVGDVYYCFRSLPLPARAILIMFLIWVAWKLL